MYVQEKEIWDFFGFGKPEPILSHALFKGNNLNALSISGFQIKLGTGFGVGRFFNCFFAELFV
jgi:hypothetical protein